MILASLCNYKEGLESGLMLVEEDLSSYRYVKPSKMPIGGVTGLAMDERWIYAATQSQVIAVMDRESLQLASFFIFNKIKDPHSILLDDSRLLVVSTGTNCVMECPVKAGFVKGEEVFWKPSEQGFGSDTDHLNSILMHDGRLFVTGFGRKDGFWNSARNGFLMDLESREKLFEGFKQPHTLLSRGNDFLLCESGCGGVREAATEKKAVLDGYTRGLCLGSKGLYVALSVGRTISRSTGQENPDPRPWRSGIYLLDPETFAVRKYLEIPDREFYELMAVGEEARGWTYS